MPINNIFSYKIYTYTQIYIEYILIAFTCNILQSYTRRVYEHIIYYSHIHVQFMNI